MSLACEPALSRRGGLVDQIFCEFQRELPVTQAENAYLRNWFFFPSYHSIWINRLSSQFCLWPWYPLLGSVLFGRKPNKDSAVQRRSERRSYVEQLLVTLGDWQYSCLRSRR